MLRNVVPSSLLAVTLVAGSLATMPAHAEDRAVKLRYGFKPMQEHSYAVKIAAVLPGTEETLTGTSTYKVQSVSDSQIVLQHSGSLTSNRKETRPAGAPPRIPRPPVFGNHDHVHARAGDVKIEPTGKVLAVAVHSPISYMLGDLQVLVLEEFPADGRNQWSREREVLLTQRPAGGPFFVPPPFRVAPAETGPSETATESLGFTIKSCTPTATTITKKYDLSTKEKSGKEPKRQYVGEGELVFDSQAGMLSSLTMKYELRINEENVSIKVPVTLSCHLMTAEEVARQKLAQEEARKRAEAAVAEANRIRPVEAGEMVQLLKDLGSNNGFTVRKAADRLAKAPVNDRQKEVAQALAELLKDRDDGLRASACKAMVVWALPENVPALVKAAGESNHFLKVAALEALGRFKTKESAEAVAAGMIALATRAQAARSLIEMGPIAEPSVVKLLKDRDGFVSREACKVLEKIGTAESLLGLEEYARTGNTFGKNDANAAMKAIKARLAEPK